MEILDTSLFSLHLTRKNILFGLFLFEKAFIATPNSIIDFLNSFEKVRFTTACRYHLMHVVALPTNYTASNEYIDQILNHPAIKGLIDNCIDILASKMYFILFSISLFCSKDIPNILIISPSSSEDASPNSEIIDGTSFDLISSQFYGRYNNSNPRLLDTFNVEKGIFVENVNLFADKLSNLQGRQMRVALFNYKPYTIWEKVVRLDYFNRRKFCSV